MSDKILNFLTDYIQVHGLSRSTDQVRYIHFGYNNEESEEDLTNLLAGRKSAGFIVKEWFEVQEVNLPKEGLILVFADYFGVPKAIGKVTNTEIVAYKDVTEDMAKDMAMGDGSLNDWRVNRTKSLIEDCNNADIAFSKETELVIYWFETLYIGEAE